MTNRFVEFLQWFGGSIQWCYPVIILLFIMKFLLRGEWKNEMLNLLVVINTLLLISILITIVYFGVELRKIYYPSQTQYEWFAFTHPWPFSITSFYKIWIVVSLILLLFFLKPFRQSWFFSLMALLLLNWFGIYLFVTKYFENHQPSTWQVMYEEDFWSKRITYFLVFIVSVILTYSILYVLKKLPFVSVLIKIRANKTDVQ